jgi:mandelate racemase
VLRPMAGFLENDSPLLEGRAVAPADISRFFAAKFRLLGRDGLVGIALSVLDMALWDALGQAAGMPVATLLGAEPRPMPAYDSYGIVDPDKDRDRLEATLKAGFRAIKIKIGAAAPAAEAAQVARIREIVGPDIAIMVDFNQSQTARQAIDRVRLIEEHGIAWVEEPVPSEDLNGHAAVRAAIRPPVMSGENWWYAGDMEKALAAGACDYAMPDVIKIGGVTGWLEVAGLAAAAAVPLSNHTHNEVSAHVMPMVRTPGWFEWLDLASAVLTEPFEPVDGCALARGTGLGMVWDEAAVARCRL